MLAFINEVHVPAYLSSLLPLIINLDVNQDLTPLVIDNYEHLDYMKVIKGGKFLTGINDPESDSGEFPMQEAEVKPFYVDSFPVTNAQFWWATLTLKSVTARGVVCFEMIYRCDSFDLLSVCLRRFAGYWGVCGTGNPPILNFPHQTSFSATMQKPCNLD